jgi:hypothetical protein
MNRSHPNTVPLLRWTIHPVNHRRSQTALEWFGLTRPIRIGAGYHHSAITARNGYQFLGIRLPPLDIQHTITDVLKIDE